MSTEIQRVPLFLTEAWLSRKVRSDKTVWWSGFSRNPVSGSKKGSIAASRITWLKMDSFWPIDHCNSAMSHPPPKKSVAARKVSDWKDNSAAWHKKNQGRNRPSKEQQTKSENMPCGWCYSENGFILWENFNAAHISSLNILPNPKRSHSDPTTVSGWDDCKPLGQSTNRHPPNCVPERNCMAGTPDVKNLVKLLLSKNLNEHPYLFEKYPTLFCFVSLHSVWKSRSHCFSSWSLQFIS